MAINYKNVVSLQAQLTGNGATLGYSGLTLINKGVSGDVGFGVIGNGTTGGDIRKHKGFILMPSTASALSVKPTYFNAAGAAILGSTLSVAAAGAPVEVPLRMKSFTGLTGGSIAFVV